MKKLELTKIQKRGLIFVLGVIAALGPLSIDMYLPAFPEIAKDLNTTSKSVSLTLTSYFIGISLGQLFYGPIMDKYGRKKPLILGLSIFLISALACSFTPNINTLILFRFTLAVGGCAGMVASRAIVRDLFDDKEIARVFSTLILIMGVAPILAPALGSWMINIFNWRYIFIFLSVFSAMLILLVVYTLPESNLNRAKAKLKLNSSLVNYYHVLKNPLFLNYALSGTFSMAAMFTYIAGSPLVLIEIYGLEEHNYAYIFGLNAAGFIVGSQVNSFLLRKKDTERLSFSTNGLAVIIGIAFLLVSVFTDISLNSFLIFLFSIMFLLGFVNPNTSALAIIPFSQNAGVASALLGSLRMLSGALASALLSVFYSGTELSMVALILFFLCASFAFLIRSKYQKANYR